MNEAFREILTVSLVLLGMAGIAVGKVPFLAMNRAAIAVCAAAALVAAGSLPWREALDAIDAGTLVLLFAMMVVVAALRLSGFFALVSSRLARLAARPGLFLAAVIVCSGVLSALFLNDTICLVLTPIVTASCLGARRDPVPFLVGLATSANIGSAATIIGNPQNMLIGAKSGISFASFAYRLGVPSLFGLAIAWIVIRLVFPAAFRSSGPGTIPAYGADGIGPAEPLGAALRLGEPTGEAAGTALPGRAPYRPLVIKALLASAGMLAGFLAGVPVVLAALVAAAFLLASRRVRAERLLAGVDYGLLVFFAGLFVITAASARTASFAWFESTLLARAVSNPWAFSGATAFVSNVISNVPAVMVMSPLAAASAEPERIWLMLAMASTYAGNLTLVGSVANLIVAEGARAQGVRLGFVAYLKAGLPITILTLAAGTAWLGLAP